MRLPSFGDAHTKLLFVLDAGARTAVHSCLRNKVSNTME